MYKLALALCVVASLALQGQALKCYKCAWFDYTTDNALLSAGLASLNAGNDQKCEKHGADFLASPTSTDTCSSSQTICYKADVDFDYTFFGAIVSVEYIGRGCDVPKAAGIGCSTDTKDFWTTTAGVSGERGVGCACNDDLCNSSSRAILSAAVLLLGVVMSLLL